MSIVLESTLLNQDYSGTGTSTPNSTAGGAFGTHSHLIVGIRYFAPGVTINSVIDGGGVNTYTPLVTKTNSLNNADLALYLAEDITAFSGGVQFNMSAAVAFWTIGVLEYSGLLSSGSADQTATGQQNSGTTVTSGSYTTTQASEVLVAMADNDTSGANWTAGSGYTKQLQDSSGVVMFEDKIVSSIQSSVTSSATLNTTADLTMVVATLKGAGGGGGILLSQLTKQGPRGLLRGMRGIR